MHRSPAVVVLGPFGLLLLAIALGATLLGMMLLSQATLGVGLIAGGCVLAICARIAQAGTHHQAAMRSLAERERNEVQ